MRASFVTTTTRTTVFVTPPLVTDRRVRYLPGATDPSGLPVRCTDLADAVEDSPVPETERLSPLGRLLDHGVVAF